MKKTSNKPVNLGGRPTKMNDETTKKLEDILKIGGTVEDACTYAQISTPTYYDWLNKNESFLAKMESAKRYADIAAKNVIVDKIIKEKSDTNARWWLEKRRPDEFGPPKKDDDRPNQQLNVIVNDSKFAERLAGLFGGLNQGSDTGKA